MGGVDGSGDEGIVFLPDSMARDSRVYPASHYAPVDALPDPEWAYDHLFAQDT